MTTCPVCGGALPAQRGPRARRYCSRACQAKAYRARQREAQEQRLAPIRGRSCWRSTRACLRRNSPRNYRLTESFTARGPYKTRKEAALQCAMAWIRVVTAPVRRTLSVD